VVYDITRRDTFAAVQEWIDDARRNTRDNVVIVVVGNKRDRDDKCVQGTCHKIPF
jgi:GTPase SAR1 family protein